MIRRPGASADRRFALVYAGGNDATLRVLGQTGWQLGVAFSRDGKQFTRISAAESPYAHATTPFGDVEGLVLLARDVFPSVTGVDHGIVADPDLVVRGTTYHLYFSSVGVDASGAFVTGTYGISHATSTDLVHWTARPDNPIPTGTSWLPRIEGRERDAGGVPAPIRFWDDRIGGWSVSVLPGEVYVTDLDECITTVLGSCVSTCVRHPVTGAGGMNHLVLPSEPKAPRAEVRDSRPSLDRLVSSVLSYGGRIEDLEIKVFGGGRVIASASDIGQLNIAAVRKYFAAAGLSIAIQDGGGGVARRLRYFPRTGRAQVLRMTMRETNPPRLP